MRPSQYQLWLRQEFNDGHLHLAYDYMISYKPGVQHANADILNRLPLPDAPTSVPIPGDTVFLIDTLENSPVTAVNIKMWTNRDPLVSKVRDMVL